MSISICRNCRSEAANRPGTLCYRCYKAAGGAEVSVSAGAEVSDQLRQMRAALVHRGRKNNSDPSVQAWVEFKKENFKAFMTMLDRLEREVRFAPKPTESAVPEQPKSTYDASKDEGGTRVKKLISDWLDELKAKAEAKVAEVEGPR